jgi:hypothetical protein
MGNQVPAPGRSRLRRSIWRLWKIDYRMNDYSIQAHGMMSRPVGNRAKTLLRIV